MTRSQAVRSSFGLITVCCAAWFIASLNAGASKSLLIARQSASPTPTPVPSSGLPVVSPDGSRIAFTSSRGGTDDVFVISPNGTNERRLTNTLESEGNLAWTASGKQILFSVFKDNIGHLYGIDPDGKNQHEFASVPISRRAPSKSKSLGKPSFQMPYRSRGLRFGPCSSDDK